MRRGRDPVDQRDRAELREFGAQMRHARTAKRHDDDEGKRGGQRAERIDHRLGDIRRHPEDLQRQGVVAARSEQGAGERVIAEREAEKRDTDDQRRDDRQHHMGEGLPGRGTLIARGHLEGEAEVLLPLSATSSICSPRSICATAPRLRQPCAPRWAAERQGDAAEPGASHGVGQGGLIT